MAELLSAQDVMFTPFEPKLKNRFIMQIDGIPAYMIKTANRPQVTFEEVTLEHMLRVRGDGKLYNVHYMIQLFHQLLKLLWSGFD